MCHCHQWNSLFINDAYGHLGTWSSSSWASTSIVGFPKYSFVFWTQDFTEWICFSTAPRSFSSCFACFPWVFSFSCMLQEHQREKIRTGFQTDPWHQIRFYQKHMQKPRNLGSLLQVKIFLKSSRFSIPWVQFKHSEVNWASLEKGFSSLPCCHATVFLSEAHGDYCMTKFSLETCLKQQTPLWGLKHHVIGVLATFRNETL